MMINRCRPSHNASGAYMYACVLTYREANKPCSATFFYTVAKPSTGRDRGNRQLLLWSYFECAVTFDKRTGVL